MDLAAFFGQHHYFLPAAAAESCYCANGRSLVPTVQGSVGLAMWAFREYCGNGAWMMESSAEATMIKRWCEACPSTMSDLQP